MEEVGLSAYDFDAQAFLFAAHDMDGAEQEGRGHGRLVQSCSQHKGAHGDPSDYPELVDASAE